MSFGQTSHPLGTVVFTLRSSWVIFLYITCCSFGGWCRYLNYSFLPFSTTLILVQLLLTFLQVINSLFLISWIITPNKKKKKGNKIQLGLHDLSGVQAYLAGLTFALAASPCSTPVLATLLGYVASTKVHICSPSFKVFGNYSVKIF